MYTVIVCGKIETWERTFADIYHALKYAGKQKEKGFTVEIIEML
jgi:hypothetical protein